MRLLYLISALCLIASNLSPQTSSADQAAAIERAKHIVVSALDHSLPKVTLEFFVNYEAAGSSVDWKVMTCPEADGQRKLSSGAVCVESEFEVHDRDTDILVSVGSFEDGKWSTPAVIRTTVTDPNGAAHNVQLRDLPMALRRPMPRFPKDLPQGVRA